MQARGASEFVGRRPEQRWLLERLELATRGSPQCVLISGPPGIGKSRLALEFCSRGEAGGFEVLAGRCYEGVSLPFLPFRDDVFPALGGDLDAHLHDLPDVEAQTSAPMRLLLEIARRLLEVSAQRPSMLLLDDVHWADPSSLALLRHLVFRMASPHEGSRLLVVATARITPEVEPLRREHHCSVIELRGLDALESAQLARAVGAEDVSPGAIHAATGGNPMLIEVTASGDHGTDPPAALVDLVDSRVAALDSATRAILQLAALLGPRLSLELVHAAGSWDAATVDDAIDVAVTAGILSLDPLAFTHPSLRSRCAREVSGRRLRDLHARIAYTLGVAVAENGDVIEVARHLILARDLAEPEEVATVAARAGHEAMRLCAWEEAAELFEAAIAARHRGKLSTPRREESQLRLLAGQCRRFAFQPERAVRQAELAAERSRDDHDLVGETNAEIERLRCQLLSGNVVRETVETVRNLVDSVRNEEPALAAAGLVEVSQTEWMEGRVDDARATIERALLIAEAMELHDVAERAFVSRSVTEWMNLDLESALVSLDAAEVHAYRSDDASRRIGPAYRRPVTLLWLGRLEDAERAAIAADAIAEEVTVYEYGLALAARVGLAAVKGNLSAAEDHVERAMLIQRLSGYRWAAGLTLPALAGAYLRRGDYDRATATLDVWAPTADKLAQVLLARLRDLIDVLSERRGRDVLENLGGIPREPFLGTQDWAVVAIEIARRLHEPEPIEHAISLLEASVTRGMQFSSALVALLPRVIADGLAVVGRVEEANARYLEAIEFAEKVGAVEELVLAELGLAQMLATRDRDVAIARLRRARVDIERLGLAGVAIDATELGIRLGIESPTIGSTLESITRTCVILFVDVVESTRLTEELGDRADRAQQRVLDARLRSVVEQFRGRHVPGVNLGDGLIALFDTASDAAMAAPRAVEAAVRSGLQVHVGMHQGDLLEEGDQVYGHAVNLAARICAQTGPDEVLVSERVRELLSGSDVSRVGFVDRGYHNLKGVAQTQHLFALVSVR